MGLETGDRRLENGDVGDVGDAVAPNVSLASRLFSLLFFRFFFLLFFGGWENRARGRRREGAWIDFPFLFFSFLFFSFLLFSFLLPFSF